MFEQDAILQWFSQYAYQPLWVYSGITVMMFISAFGFPLPEEVPLIGSGLVAFMARNPDLYPPPPGVTARVHTSTLAMVAFGAVLASDYVVFSLGRYSVRHMEARGWFSGRMSEAALLKLREWTRKYGVWACGLFRFTPGLRFPGFLASGALGIRRTHFLMIDGLAALVSVPTQVILVALYGETILKYLKQFKMVLGGVFLLILLVFVVRRMFRAWRGPQAV